MSPFASRIRQLSRLTITIALALAGCGNECDPNAAASCDGTTVVSCEWSGDGPFAHTFVSRSACPVACARLTFGAECVLSPQPVAECHGATTACWQGRVAFCSDDFPTSAMDCGSGATCADSTCGPVCAASATPEPRCATSQGFCDGDSLVGCTCGLAGARQLCGAGQCIARGFEAFCALSPTVDPRCGDPGQQVSGFCADNTGFNCQYGFVVGTIGCGSFTCSSHPGASPSCDSGPLPSGG